MRVPLDPVPKHKTVKHGTPDLPIREGFKRPRRSSLGLQPCHLHFREWTRRCAQMKGHGPGDSPGALGGWAWSREGEASTVLLEAEPLAARVPTA